MDRKMPFSVKLLILTALTVTLWVGFEVYRAFSEEPEPVVPAEILAPLSPTLDISSLNLIGQRVHLTEEQIGDTVLLEGGNVLFGRGAPLEDPVSVETEEPEFLQVEEENTATDEGESITESLF